MTEKEWRDHIENRRKNSEVWQFIHFLGSLRLAMILLLTIPIACAVATIYESKFDTHVAQAYVYKAPWFLFWLLVLCVNLFCVTLTRWPWRRKHWGFVITHYGIIVLLAGGVVGQKFGFEASVTLHAGAEATRQLVINRTILQVESGMDRIAYKIPFPVNVTPPTEAKPKTVPIPHSDLKLLIDRYSEQLAEVTEVTASPIPGSGAGVALSFSSSMMAQTVPVNLAKTPPTATKSDFFSRAEIELVDALPDRSDAKPPEDAFRETQMVFANFEPIITSHFGKPSGYRIALTLEGAKPMALIESVTGHREMYELSAVLGKPIALHGERTQIVIRDYWPDMEMQDGKPVSKSDQPNNPAILVMLTNEGSAAGAKPLLEVAHAPEGGIVYQTSRGGVVQNSGKVPVGGSFETGWADWKVEVTQALPNAMISSRMVPLDDNADPSLAANTSATGKVISGIRARLLNPAAAPAEKTGEPVWVPSGRGVTLQWKERTVFLGFGLEVYNLPFTLELLKFEVPRDEGTDSPADFRSTVRFNDPVRNRTLEALIHMNHPASYPDGWWRVVLGQNYKFSQAHWNPEDPDETTLQVLHDPGWPLKWIGSLLICVGIAIMFYLKPKPQQRTGASTSARKTAPTS